MWAANYAAILASYDAVGLHHRSYNFSAHERVQCHMNRDKRNNLQNISLLSSPKENKCTNNWITVMYRTEYETDPQVHGPSAASLIAKKGSKRAPNWWQLGSGKRYRAEIIFVIHTEWRRKCHTTDCTHNTFLFLQKHLTSGTELILIGWKTVPNESL